MAEGRQVDEWNRTALLAALIAEPNRDAKRHPKQFAEDDFHPFLAKKKKRRKTAARIFSILAGIDGIEPETVTAETSWAHQTSSPVDQSSQSTLKTPASIADSTEPNAA